HGGRLRGARRVPERRRAHVLREAAHHDARAVGGLHASGLSRELAGRALHRARRARTPLGVGTPGRPRERPAIAPRERRGPRVGGVPRRRAVRGPMGTHELPRHRRALIAAALALVAIARASEPPSSPAEEKPPAEAVPPPPPPEAVPPAPAEGETKK